MAGKKSTHSIDSVQLRAGLICLPFVLGFCVIYAFPVVAVLWYSMQENRFSKRFIGIKNYVLIWKNQLFLRSIINTFVITLLCVLLSLIVALIICYCLNFRKFRYKSVLMLFMLPMMLPSVSVTSIWREIWNTSAFSGSVSNIFVLLSLFLWKYSSSAIVLILFGLKGLPKEMNEAARIDGAGEMRIYLQISVPAAKAHISLSVIVLLMFALRIYKESYLLFGEYPERSTYLIQHYMSNHFIRMNSQNVSAASISFTGLCLMLYYIIYRLGNIKLKGGLLRSCQGK